jgi:putative tributyrin esterase
MGTSSSAAYHPITLSNPTWETESIRQLTFFSPALRQRGDVSLFVPPEAAEQRHVPLFILLHGVYGSHWSWFRQGGAHQTAVRMMREGTLRPIIIAAPSDGLFGDSSAYLNHSGGLFESWIVEDLLSCLKETLPQIDLANVCIAGLSMGGYGALRLGAKYPKAFRAIAAHSAITKREEFSLFCRNIDFIYSASEQDANILHWINVNRSRLPKLRFDCGDSDLLLPGNKLFHVELVRLGICHEYEVFPGTHDWEYWSRHIADTFSFFEGVLRKP